MVVDDLSLLGGYGEPPHRFRLSFFNPFQHDEESLELLVNIPAAFQYDVHVKHPKKYKSRIRAANSGRVSSVVLFL